MTDRKFFSGLPDNMMRGSSGVPDRQRSNFYWPNETDSEQFVPSRNRMRNSSVSTASLLSQSQASSDTEESRRRKLQHNQSKIEFHDMGDVGTDSESVYSRADQRKQNKQDTLKSRIEFYDFVDTRDHDDDVQSVIERPMKINSEPSAVEHVIKVTTEKADEKQNFVNENLTQSVQNLNLNSASKNGFAPQSYIPPENSRNLMQNVQNSNLNSASKNGFVPQSYIPPETSRKKVPQYVDSYSESDDEDRFYRTRNHVMEERRYQPPRYPPSQRSIWNSTPRRYNSEYFDFDDDGYDRQYDSARRLKYRKPEMPRIVRRREYSPEVSDEDFYDNVDGYRRGQEYSRARIPPPERFRSNGSSRVDETESYYRGRNSNRRPSGSGYGSERDFHSPPVRKPSPQTPNNMQQEEAPGNGYASEMEPQMSTAARPPIKPLSRTMSINEAKQRYHVNLKSNIFHNDPEYNVLVEQKKPLSVRDFAARQRVGVGLPDI